MIALYLIFAFSSILLVWGYLRTKPETKATLKDMAYHVFWVVVLFVALGSAFTLILLLSAK